jgi:hypothetical protein
VADVKPASFLLAKQEQQGDYNTEREAGRLLKMQPEDPDKAVNLPSFLIYFLVVWHTGDY